jgi:hypothetical protein
MLCVNRENAACVEETRKDIAAERSTSFDATIIGENSGEMSNASALVLESTVHSELKAYSPLLSNIFRKGYLIKENRNQRRPC